MTLADHHDLDYLAARVHGRRSRMAEAERLDSLCRIRTVPELARTIHPQMEVTTASAFQRHIVRELLRELDSLRWSLTGAAAELIEWLRIRFPLENLKLVLRARTAKLPFAQCQNHLLELPKDLALDVEALLATGSPDDLTRVLPPGFLREAMEWATKIPLAGEQPFLIEAALDRAYHVEHLIRTEHLRHEDSELLLPLAQQEADTFHLLLVARGKFLHALTRETLLLFHIAGTRIGYARFKAMLDAPDLRSAACLAFTRAVDELPALKEARPDGAEFDATAIEILTANRLYRVARRAFRHGHVGLGAIVAYLAIRRIEAANLITLSEGIRLELSPELLRAHLMPRAQPETTHV
jgi:vacuolar-type H+-ATPase subunit C/Vma6